jgi:hypothetical protein
MGDAFVAQRRSDLIAFILSWEFGTCGVSAVTGGS